MITSNAIIKTEVKQGDAYAWNFITVEDENDVVIHRYGYSSVTDVRKIMKQLDKENEGSIISITKCSDETDYNEQMKKVITSAIARGKRSVYAKEVK